MNCQTCRVEIEEVEVGERLTDEARAHLMVCHVCRAFHDERQTLKKLVGSLGAVSAPPDFDFRLRARLAAAKGAGNHRPFHRSFLASAPAIGLAASFALIVAGVVLYKQMKSGPAANTQPSSVAQQTPVQSSEKGSAVSAVSPVGSDAASGVTSPGIESENPESRVIGKNPRPRATGGVKPDSRREAMAARASAAQGFSNDSALSPARVITPDRETTPGAESNQLVEVAVRSASQPVRVFIDDRDGAKRAVTLKPVIFGSQDLAGRNNTLASTSQGIW